MTAAPYTPSSIRAKLTFPGLVKSEWIKLLSLRSTYWVLGVFVVVTVGLSAIIVSVLRWGAKEAARTGEVIAGAFGQIPLAELLAQTISLFGQVVIGVFGVLMVTNEYSSGMIRTSFTAAPRRLSVIFAKMIVLGLVSLLVSCLATLTSYLLGHSLGQYGIDVSLTNGENWRVLLGLQLYILAIAYLGLMIGLLFRATAGSIAGLMVLTFVLPVVANIVSGLITLGGALVEITGWRKLLLYVFEVLPSNAGGKILAYTAEATSSATPSLNLSPWVGFGVLCLWVVAFAIPGISRLLSRDA